MSFTRFAAELYLQEEMLGASTFDPLACAAFLNRPPQTDCLVFRLKCPGQRNDRQLVVYFRDYYSYYYYHCYVTLLTEVLDVKSESYEPSGRCTGELSQ